MVFWCLASLLKWKISCINASLSTKVKDHCSFSEYCGNPCSHGTSVVWILLLQNTMVIPVVMAQIILDRTNCLNSSSEYCGIPYSPGTLDRCCLNSSSSWEWHKSLVRCCLNYSSKYYDNPYSHGMNHYFRCCQNSSSSEYSCNPYSHGTNHWIDAV